MYFVFAEAPVIDYGHIFWRMLLSLGALIGLLILTVWALKRMGKFRLQTQNQLKAIKIVESRVLSSKTMLYLVEAEGKKILLAESHLEIKAVELKEPNLE